MLLHSETPSCATRLLDFPDDILLNLLEFIPLETLAILCLTCTRLRFLVTEHGWAIYLRLQGNQGLSDCPSLRSARRTWCARERLKYDTLAERAWTNCSFISRPLSPPWPENSVPSMACSDSHLVYGAGGNLYIYAYTRSKSSGAPPGMRLECKTYIQGVGIADASNKNITGLAFLPDGSLVASFDTGALMKVLFPTCNNLSSDSNDTVPCHHNYSSGHLVYQTQGSIESLSARSDLCLTISSRGEACLSNLVSGVSSSISIGSHWLTEKSANVYLSFSSRRYGALGTMDRIPLRIHSISESEFCENASLALGNGKWDSDGNNGSPNVDALVRARRSSEAVLAISDPPPHFGLSGQVLATGWMDGIVRIYDLRSSSRYAPSEIRGIQGNTLAVPTLKPVMTLYNNKARGVRTVTGGGGAGCYIAATSLMDSLVSIWDVRAYRDVWSVRAPIVNDPSTVYAFTMESSRLFGATQRRPFVYDFGPGVTTDTYPAIAPAIGDGLKLQSNGIGYKALRSRHRNETDVQ